MRFSGPNLHEEGCQCRRCRQKTEYLALYYLAVIAVCLFVAYVFVDKTFPSATAAAWNLAGFGAPE
jgi:hypothetical protein